MRGESWHQAPGSFQVKRKKSKTRGHAAPTSQGVYLQNPHFPAHSELSPFPALPRTNPAAPELHKGTERLWNHGPSVPSPSDSLPDLQDELICTRSSSMQMSQALAQQFLGDRGGGEEPGDGAGCSPVSNWALIWTLMTPGAAPRAAPVIAGGFCVSGRATLPLERGKIGMEMMEGVRWAEKGAGNHLIVPSARSLNPPGFANRCRLRDRTL